MKNIMRILFVVTLGLLVQTQVIRTGDYNAGDELTYVGTLGLFGKKADDRRTERADNIRAEKRSERKQMKRSQRQPNSASYSNMEVTEDVTPNGDESMTVYDN